jgi:hypothetical protein
VARVPVATAVLTVAPAPVATAVPTVVRERIC